MVEYNIQQVDLRDAETFLVSFMEEQITEASFDKGGAVRDILIKGFASLYAYLRGEIDRITVRQSLKRIQEELTDDDDIAQAVDEILSNWFVSRKDGEYSRSTVRLHFTERRAMSIPTSGRFYRTSTLYYHLDTKVNTYVISELQILPVFDARGELEDYVVDVPMVAAQVGSTYDVAAGNFVRVDIPGGLPYFSYAENIDDFEGGKNIEGTTELIERAETAITVRNLINNRSCDAVLQEAYPSLIETLTIGMGEVEMLRDNLTHVSKHLRIHTGGKYDTYVSLPLITVEENLTIGSYFVRSDGVINIFRDPELTHDIGGTFTSLGVKPGHVLYIRGGLPDTPRGYVIKQVYDHEIHVDELTSFTAASDEEIDAVNNQVVYSIGWLSPSFSDIAYPVPSDPYVRTAAPSTNALYVTVPYGTSRRVQQSGLVVLENRPIQDIQSVEITNPNSVLDALKDVNTGYVSFPRRVNTSPVYQAEPTDLEYQLRVANPLYGQSYRGVNLLMVGFDYTGPPTYAKSDFDGMNLRVVYSTVSSFDSIATYVESRNVRVASADHLVRARSPIWVEINVEYRLKATTTDTLDHDEAAASLAKHINDFDPNDDLDTSDLEASIRNSFDMVGAVYPMTINYYLDSPDGQQLLYYTTDIVSIFPTDTNQVVFDNGEYVTPTAEMQEDGLTYVGTTEQLITYLTQLGVSDRTIVYRSTAGRITFTQRS